MKFVKFILFIIFTTFSSWGSNEVKEVTVQDVRSKSQKSLIQRDSIIQTEVVTSEEIQKKQANNLSEAIQDEKGIESREGCSICGMRRVRINGMRGEHTTVLMDGIPLNSTVSSYYGFDAMGTSGIERVEISRGAGASLIAPEAIGGVINIIRKKASKNSSSLDLGLGDFDYRYFSGTTTHISEDKRKGTTFTAQYTHQGQRDDDQNGVNESPKNEYYLVGAKHFIDINEKNNLTFDLTSLKSSVFGGPMDTPLFLPTVNTGDLKFKDNDVRKKYIGNPDQITEAVEIQRNEFTATYTRQLDDFSNLVLKQSFAQQIQDSWYEGSDYYHKNQTLFSDIQYNRQIGLNHFFTAGVDYKGETLRSKSYAFFIRDRRNKDDYSYHSSGLYLKDIWSIKSNIELSSALRINKILTDWTDKHTEEYEIDETMLAPRFHLKWDHSDKLTSRIGLGVGYRAPLTFFESEHGILDDGFDIAVSELEKSKSATYSLSFEDQRFMATLGGTYTSVDNLAFVDMDESIPTLKNFNQELYVSNYDLTLGYQISKTLSTGVSFEHFDYESQYKKLLVVAAVEDRAKLDLEYESNDVMVNLMLTWVGARDLKDYGYADRFNVKDDTNTKKITNAPSFITVDLKGSYSISSQYKVYAGVKNLFDEVQEESPLFFDEGGEFDVTHIYGPLRGRQVYAGIQSSF